MRSAEVLIDAFGRVREVVQQSVAGLDADQLAARPDGRPDSPANSIAWLVWHLTRVQDDHLADAFTLPQVWTSKGWAQRFALPLELSDTGYAHSAEQVATVRVSGGLLTGYHDAVYEQSIRRLRVVSNDDLDRIVDERWDPPVTLGVRLISVISDDLQHAGQAAYASGLLRTG